MGKSSQSFYEACEASITLITKPDKANLGNKNCRPPNDLVKAMVFPVVMYGCESWTVSAKELMLLNCGVGEDS